MPFVLGHALSMHASHGGQATHDNIDAHQIAVRRRGGMLPHAYGSPASRRATRDRWRRRMSRLRPRAALLTPVQQPNSQDNLPESGQKLAYQAKREGVAERFPDPAGQQRLEVDLAWLNSYDRLLTALERSLVNTATAHTAQRCYRLRSIPGVGKLLALVGL